MTGCNRAVCMEELPAHLILEILSSGHLGAADLACFEATCRMFCGDHGLFPDRFQSMVEIAAFLLCKAHSIFSSFPPTARTKLLDRCGGNWKKVLRFLQSVEHSSSSVETSSGNMQVTAGRYHTLLVHGSSVYSCGSSSCGVLGHGQEITQCAAFSRISLPSQSFVTHISASHNHTAFVVQSGEVFTCGDNSSFCCGHGEVGHAIFRPTRIEALKGTPCKQVATGLSFTVILTTQGQVYTCGSNAHGQLGHGDTVDRPTPRKIELFEGLGHVVQIAAGASYTFAVTDDGVCARKRKTFVLTNEGCVFAFGWTGFGSLGFSDRGISDKVLQPCILDSLRPHRVSQISTGLYHTVAVTSTGLLFGFGDNERAQLGHDEMRSCLKPTEIMVHQAMDDIYIEVQDN
ncbi:hypothetical protein C4D60_Mb02t11850 [Musa balbisiana]|uniref:Ultraviolet-B receptor UVR8 n=1 Tax=Musa balbisiana TaxID=52838 RepID=A0A4S8IA06_MUSBA|nr:hypothetical protein C4D60_Mb02t11850 [Musa balbisiana]